MSSDDNDTNSDSSIDIDELLNLKHEKKEKKQVQFFDNNKNNDFKMDTLIDMLKTTNKKVEKLYNMKKNKKQPIVVNNQITEKKDKNNNDEALNAVKNKLYQIC